MFEGKQQIYNEWFCLLLIAARNGDGESELDVELELKKIYKTNALHWVVCIIAFLALYIIINAKYHLLWGRKMYVVSCSMGLMIYIFTYLAILNYECAVQKSESPMVVKMVEWCRKSPNFLKFHFATYHRSRRVLPSMVQVHPL